MTKQLEKKDAPNNPVLGDQQGFRQPDRVKVRRQVAQEQGEQIASIFARSNSTWIEWSIVNTTPQLKTHAVDAWNLSRDDNEAVVFCIY